MELEFRKVWRSEIQIIEAIIGLFRSEGFHCSPTIVVVESNFFFENRKTAWNPFAVRDHEFGRNVAKIHVNEIAKYYREDGDLFIEGRDVRVQRELVKRRPLSGFGLIIAMILGIPLLLLTTIFSGFFSGILTTLPISYVGYKIGEFAEGIFARNKIIAEQIHFNDRVAQVLHKLAEKGFPQH